MSSPSTPPWWLQMRSLQQSVNHLTWERGQQLFLRDKVQWVQIAPKSKGWLVKGDVQGSASEPYQVDVHLDRAPDGQVLAWKGD